MPLQFDHAVIAVSDLERAIEDYRDLGFTVFRGGVHANRATENALIVFEDGTYLELLARTQEEPIEGLIDFSVLLNNGEGLVGYALRTDDIETEAERLREAGFAVGDIIAGERRRGDGTLIQWKLALIDGGFAPFMIQDVTPRELRITTDTTLTTHPNRAAGTHGVEIAVRSIEDTWKRYTRLFDISPDYHAMTYRNVGCITLHQADASKLNYFLNELPDYLQMFSGMVPQAEINAADPNTEPKMFTHSRTHTNETLARLRREADEERALAAAVKNNTEALFMIRLVREQQRDDRFILEKTHGVRFRQFIGVSPKRGADILIGLDDFDWSSVEHAYGKATDVPLLLRALASNDKDVRHHTYEILYGNIVHQGTVYPASIEVIPFLIQLLEAPQVQDKVYLLNLLADIGEGPNEVEERAEMLLKDALPHYLTLLNHSNSEIRLLVAELLEWYPQEIALLEPLLKQCILTDDEPAVRGKCLQSLAYLWASTSNTPLKLSIEQTMFVERLMRDESQAWTLQVQAVQILMRDDGDAWLDAALAVFHRIRDVDRKALELDNPWKDNMLYGISRALLPYPTKALEWLIAQSQHPNAEIRQHVPFALGQLLTANQSVNAMIPTIVRLMHDPSPDVRQSAVGFFYNKPFAKDVEDILRDIAANDVSLTVRVVAQNTLKFMEKS